METLRRTVIVVGVIGILVAVVLALAVDAAFAGKAAPTEEKASVVKLTPEDSNYYIAVVLGAALSAGFGFLGAGYAVARVGAAALGAASERPELLARSIVLVALGESIAIFGFAVAMMLVLRLPG